MVVTTKPGRVYKHHESFLWTPYIQHQHDTSVSYVDMMLNNLEATKHKGVPTAPSVYRCPGGPKVSRCMPSADWSSFVIELIRLFKNQLEIFTIIKQFKVGLFTIWKTISHYLKQPSSMINQLESLTKYHWTYLGRVNWLWSFANMIRFGLLDVSVHR